MAEPYVSVSCQPVTVDEERRASEARLRELERRLQLFDLLLIKAVQANQQAGKAAGITAR